MDLATKIIEYMRHKQYYIADKPKQFNIVYIEGMNEDGALNDDVPNEFNDRRMVIEFVGKIPKIINHWQATTEPGDYYTHHPMNLLGAARIAFGQYQAWRVGTHGKAEPHEALIQMQPIFVCRDFNKDFKRTADKTDFGLFGINQHWGYDFPQNNIKGASAGCLVGRRRQGHKEFMAIVKSDVRYIADKKYTFFTTVIAGDDLLASVC